jgi:hypothetical protein
MIRKIWLVLFLLGNVLELIALFVEKQFVLSSVCFTFSFAVYHFSFKRPGTALLTFQLWCYWILFVLFCGVSSILYFAHHWGNTAVFLRQMQWTGSIDFTAVSVFLLSGLYVVSYVYATKRLRDENRRKKNE